MAHWTSDSLEDFVFSVLIDFTENIWRVAEQAGIGTDDADSNTFQVDYAALGKLVGESSRRVRCLFRTDLKDLSVKRACAWAKALKRDLALVLYDHDDETGPVMPEIFTACWVMCGRPRTMWDLEDVANKLNVELPDEFKPHCAGE